MGGEQVGLQRGAGDGRAGGAPCRGPASAGAVEPAHRVAGSGGVGGLGGGGGGVWAVGRAEGGGDPGVLPGGGGGGAAAPLTAAGGGGGEPFPGAQQVIEVGGQGGEVGDVGAEVVAAGAAEPDRAGASAGLHVRRLGAAAIGDGDLADRITGVRGFQQSGGVAPDPGAVPVDADGGHLVDRLAAAVFADPVVASAAPHV